MAVLVLLDQLYFGGTLYYPTGTGSEHIELHNHSQSLYNDIFSYENSLPQHNKSLPFPEGESGLYFYPANHIWGMLQML